MQEIITYKQCNKCQEKKILSNFRIRNNKFINQCKQCEKQYRINNKDKRNAYNKQWILDNKDKVKEWKLNNKEKIKGYMRKYLANNKEQRARSVKKWSQSNKEKECEKQKRYRLRNKEIVLEREKKYRDMNRQKLLEKASAYKKTEKGKIVSKNYNHKRRTISKQSEIETNELLKLEQNAKVCYWCNTSLKKKKVHIDHYVPLAKGGKHELSNLVISCQKCNLTKSAKDPIVFANSIGRLL